ncbi:MAG: ATPase [Rhodospirillales bacterium]|nr:ATPase [Rhodospirillales bacterium]
MKPTAERFYKTVAVEPPGTAAGDGRERGYAVRLDGRPIRTPGGRPLILPSLESAEAVAAEWRAQPARIEVAAMPLTRLASTALDRVAENMPAVIDILLGYAGAELLCYRAEAPADLVQRQQAQWQPLLDWAAERWDARLAVTSGVVPVAQPAAALAALRRSLEAADPWRLTALAVIAQACGSLVLALAVGEGRLDADGAFALSQLDEIYQSERWGEDYEAAERRLHLRDEIAEASAFMMLVDGGAAVQPPTPSEQGGRKKA